MKFLIVITISIFLSYSCSSSTESINSEIPLETSVGKSLEAPHITIQIPENWISIDDNSHKIFDIWLINKQFKSTIGIIPVAFSDNLLENNEEILELCEKIILSQKNQIAEVKIIDQSYRDLKYQSRHSRLEVNNNFQNLIIFGIGDNFFQALAFFDEGYAPTQSEIEQLVKIQEELINSSKIK